MSDFILHAVTCLCFDLKNRNEEEIVVFPVCSEIDNQGKIVPSVAQCPNCGNVHLIEDLGKTRLQGKDETNLLPNIEELELEVPERVARLLKLNKCPLYVWQAANYIFKFELFPNCIILSQEEQTETNKEVPTVITKMLIINEKEKFEIVSDKSEPFSVTSPT